jgi:hypothetical protein
VYSENQRITIEKSNDKKTQERTMEENKSVADIQSNKVRKKHSFKAKIFVRNPQKFSAFLSLQIHHIKQ